MYIKYAKRIFCVILVIILTSVNIAGNDVYAASKPGRPVFTISKRNKKSVVIKVNKTKNATGYQVFLSNSKNGKYQQVAASRTQKIKLLKLKKNKAYYVKVRAYKTVGYKITLGKFSKVQKIEKYSKKQAASEPEETPVPTASPNPDETPIPTDLPDTSVTPMPEDVPGSEDTSMSEDMPAPDDMLIPEETLIPEGTPIPEDTPTPEDTLIPEDMTIPEG